MKKPVTFRNPIVDATLPDGSRINIVYGGDVSKNGSNFTIRKFMGIPLSIVDICNSGMMTWQMAGYMSLIVEEGMNFFVSGETASGKTTLMNALMTFIRPDAKIVSIEDTPEVQVPHPNWTREVVRGQMSQGGGSVDMFSLLKAALRQRPNEIIIGEIRGEEGNIAFQAMMTGHAVCATFHAATVEKLIQRVTGVPISVPRTYVENLNVVVICSAVRLPNGKMGRRVISISEIIGYDPRSGSFSFVEMFRWDPVKDEFEFVGLNNSYLLEQRIAPSRGLSEKKRRQIYKEVDRRGALLAEAGRVRRHELLRAVQAPLQGPEARPLLVRTWPFRPAQLQSARAPTRSPLRARRYSSRRDRACSARSRAASTEVAPWPSARRRGRRGPSGGSCAGRERRGAGAAEDEPREPRVATRASTEAADAAAAGAPADEPRAACSGEPIERPRLIMFQATQIETRGLRILLDLAGDVEIDDLLEDTAHRRRRARHRHEPAVSFEDDARRVCIASSAQRIEPAVVPVSA